ncbi:MAG: polysaccharide deacetylase family protein [Bacteroidota bacterium]|nr:polysaccharide deacetylase family protein [Bacteroidota bacterium]
MIKNFLFHRVNPKRDPLWDPMDVGLFEKCINYISKTYEVALIEDLVSSNEINSENKFATIMFDDGYKDNIEYAAPILDKYKVKASFYVVTNCIDQNIVTWTHELEHLFQFANKTEIKMDLDFLPDELKISQLKDNSERMAYVRKLKPFLKKISHVKRNKVLEIIAQTYNDVQLPKLMMGWKDLSELKNAGHYIGSHSVTHAMLGTMTDENEIKNELQLSGIKIKEHLGYFPQTISYPVGSFNEATKHLAKETGYTIGLAVKQTVYDQHKTDIFEIPRIELYNEPWWKTRLRITNTLENVKSLIGYK